MLKHQVALIEGKEKVNAAKLKCGEIQIEVEEMKKKLMAARFAGANADSFIM